MTINELIDNCIHPITGWKVNLKKYSIHNKLDNEIRKYHSENHDLDRNKMAY